MAVLFSPIQNISEYATINSEPENKFKLRSRISRSSLKLFRRAKKTYLGCAVDVKSWSINCPHWANIIVTGASARFEPCTSKLINRADSNGSPDTDRRIDSIPSA